MSMRYIDRKGVEITHEEWLSHTCDRKYCLVERAIGTLTGTVYEACWLGVWLTSYESTPMPFCISRREAVARGQVEILGWFSSEKTVLAEINRRAKADAR